MTTDEYGSHSVLMRECDEILVDGVLVRLVEFGPTDTGEPWTVKLAIEADVPVKKLNANGGCVDVCRK
jgi:hypothetical protein